MIQSVTRQTHWKVVCACGALLSQCGCEHPNKHIEVWQDGCAWSQKWHRAAPVGAHHLSPENMAPHTPQPRKILAEHLPLIVEAFLAGVTMVALARRFHVTPAAIHHHLRRRGLTSKQRRRCT